MHIFCQLYPEVFHFFDVIIIKKIILFFWAAWVAQRFSAAFSPGPDLGDPGSSPTSGSLPCMEPASPSACVSAPLSLSLS